MGSWSPVRSWSLGSRLFQAWRACERFSILFVFLAEIRFACCRRDFVQLPISHTEQLVFAICLRPGSRSAPRDTSRASPSLKPRTGATIGPLLSSRRRLRGSTLKFAASFFFAFFITCFSTACTTLSNVPCQGRPASPTRTALLPEPIWQQNSSAPSTWYVASYRFSLRKTLISCWRDCGAS